MLRSKTSVVLLILQCCWAFHSPQQWGGEINRGVGHAINKQSKLTSFQVSPDTAGDSGDFEVSETSPISARDDVGEGNFGKKLGLKRQIAVVGAPQTLVEDEDEIQLSKMNITQVMTELQAIQSQGPKKYCILGTRHCSFLHQQIVEML